MSRRIHAHLQSIAQPLSPALADAIAAVGPVTLTRRTGPLPDALCRAVAGQQLSVKAAATIWNRLLERANGRLLAPYLRRARPETLRACGLSAAKTKALRAIAEAHHQGQLDPSDLAQLHHTQRAENLTTLPGVGPWTADMINIFYFGEQDLWPDGDIAARNTLQRLTHPRRSTLRTAAHFTPYRSYLALYLWRHLDNAPIEK